MPDEPDLSSDAHNSYYATISELKTRFDAAVEARISPSSELSVAIKADGLKPRFDLIPWDAIAEIQKVYQFGSRKYSPRNWEKGFDWLRLWNAAMRHMTAWESGETHDPETKLSHTVHAAFCILALVAHEIRHIGTDNRHKPESGGTT